MKVRKFSVTGIKGYVFAFLHNLGDNIKVNTSIFLSFCCGRISLSLYPVTRLHPRGGMQHPIIYSLLTPFPESVCVYFLSCLWGVPPYSSWSVMV